MTEAEIIERFARNLERLVKRKKISWLKLSKETGIPRVSLWRYKTMRFFPNWNQMSKLLTVLNADISELFKR